MLEKSQKCAKNMLEKSHRVVGETKYVLDMEGLR